MQASNSLNQAQEHVGAILQRAQDCVHDEPDVLAIVECGTDDVDQIFGTHIDVLQNHWAVECESGLRQLASLKRIRDSLVLCLFLVRNDGQVLLDLQGLLQEKESTIQCIQIVDQAGQYAVDLETRQRQASMSGDLEDCAIGCDEQSSRR